MHGDESERINGLGRSENAQIGCHFGVWQYPSCLCHIGGLSSPKPRPVPQNFSTSNQQGGHSLSPKTEIALSFCLIAPYGIFFTFYLFLCMGKKYFSRGKMAHRLAKYIENYWGKAESADDGALLSHPLAYHMLDVGAVAQALLQARPKTLDRFAQLLAILQSDVLVLLPLVAALHDLGKFARAFQCKVPALWHEGGPIPPAHTHAQDGWLLWNGARGQDNGLSRDAAARIWPDGLRALNPILRASLGHHGRPLSSQPVDVDLALAYGPGEVVARTCAADLIALLLPQPLNAKPPKLQAVEKATFFLSGFVTLADWVGSNRTWFKFCDPIYPLTDYWRRAKDQADRAVAETGLVEVATAPQKTFEQLTNIAAPTPMQTWAETVPLSDGPTLFMIEDVTGAGKTEAAQMLVHRLMAAGSASGAYWAMPTAATANAMFARQEMLIRGLFAKGARPRLTLAHGQASLSDAFQKLMQDPTSEPYTDEDESAVASCTAYLAHDKRVSLLADVGAGTVDQALLGALPAKFNTLRLFGLAGKVLVFDEAHAYDAYVQAETEGLLRFQAALGGCAIILSATLPQKMRGDYVRAWQRGLGRQNDLWTDKIPPKNVPYPLATVATQTVSQTALAACICSRRTVAVHPIHDRDAAAEKIVAAAAAGSACAWIRNTVDDVLEAAQMLRERGLNPMVFHARFAQCDRQKREAEAMRVFGKDGGDLRAGRVLVASQVVEQSLDLDFDFMVSDLAPVDLLIQRAGRLHRHNRPRPAGAACALFVLSPDAVGEPQTDWIKGFLPGTAAVYRNANVLWRTACALAEKGAIVTPEGLRDLVEFVYDKDAPVPEALERPTAEAEGEAKARRSIGQQGVLTPNDGYIAVDAWQDERKLPTRLIDGQVTVRLGRRTDDGIVPYANEIDPRKAWALSEVHLRANRMPPDAAPPPDLAPAVAAVRAGWGRYEQDTPLIVLEPDGEGWQGRFVAKGEEKFLYYRPKEGLFFS